MLYCIDMKKIDGLSEALRAPCSFTPGESAPLEGAWAAVRLTTFRRLTPMIIGPFYYITWSGQILQSMDSVSSIVKGLATLYSHYGEATRWKLPTTT